jgi:hypothetical protein
MGLLIGLKEIIKFILNFGKAICPVLIRNENTEKRVVVLIRKQQAWIFEQM